MAGFFLGKEVGLLDIWTYFFIRHERYSPSMEFLELGPLQSWMIFFPHLSFLKRYRFFLFPFEVKKFNTPELLLTCKAWNGRVVCEWLAFTLRSASLNFDPDFDHGCLALACVASILVMDFIPFFLMSDLDPINYPVRTLS